jgi:glutathione synthase/RimK-type ligase-like ATP-grasp enzyme
MILIITHKQDYTADFVIDKLNSASIPYFRFNCEDIFSYDVSVRYGDAAHFVIANQAKFNSVWYRRTKLPELSAENAAEKIYLLNETDVFMQNLFAIIDAKWLSEPGAVNQAENKLLQLSLAKKIGFMIPETLVTTDRKVLQSFTGSHRKTIIKPIGRGRIDYPGNTSKLIYTSLLTREVIDKMDTLELTPAIYQEYIEKSYELRITVVGEDVFAASVDSQSEKEAAVDWRKKKMKFEFYKLPEKLKEKCLAMTKALNISYGAFDFIRSTSGEYYFLEVNPNGQWVWIEKDTGQPVSDAIIKFLTV